MRNAILRLAVSAAIPLVMPAALSAQAVTLPQTLAAAPAYEVPERLLAHRSDLMLVEPQVAQLAALSADLHRQAQLRSVSSKPWVTARGSSPQEAFDRSLATLTPRQRSEAVRLLTSAADPL